MRHGIDCPTWDNRRNTESHVVRESEKTLERGVSEVIGDVSLLWMAADDAPSPSSHRRYIEENAITLLGNFGKQAIDARSRSWLSHHCNRVRVRKAGLWNSNHVEERYDPDFLDAFAAQVNQVETP